MTKVDIFSGFLGAGKTTLIKKLIAEAYSGQKLVLIENEFGEIGIDGGFMAEAGIQVNELNSGCICCSLVGDFSEAMTKVVEQFHPDRLLIEPSGVGKLSDIIRAVAQVEGMEVNSATAIADASKARLYAKNFGEFYDDQIKHAGAIVLSRTDKLAQDKLDAAIALLRERNAEAVIITTPWEQLDGKQILSAIERTDTLTHALELLSHEEHHHHDHHHDEDGECHHHHGENGGHHHHDEEEGHSDGDGHGECCCHHHHGEEHHHHGEHDADEIFDSWGVETTKRFTEEELRTMLCALDSGEIYGDVLRAKGIVAAGDGEAWLHFDHVPGEAEVRRGPAGITGRLCVIGSKLNRDALRELFGV